MEMVNAAFYTLFPAESFATEALYWANRKVKSLLQIPVQPKREGDRKSMNQLLYRSGPFSCPTFQVLNGTKETKHPTTNRISLNLTQQWLTSEGKPNVSAVPDEATPPSSSSTPGEELRGWYSTTTPLRCDRSQLKDHLYHSCLAHSTMGNVSGILMPPTPVKQGLLIYSLPSREDPSSQPMGGLPNLTHFPAHMAVYTTVVLEQLIRLLLQELAHYTVKTPKARDLYHIFNANDNVYHLFRRMKLKREMEHMYRIQPTQRMVHLPGNLFNSGMGRGEASRASATARSDNESISIASTAPSTTTSVYIHHHPEEAEFVTQSVTSRVSRPYSDSPSDSIRSYSYNSLSSADEHFKAPTLASQEIFTSAGESNKLWFLAQPSPLASTSTFPRIMDIPLGSSTSLLAHQRPLQCTQVRSRANTLTAFSRAQKKYHLQSSPAPSDTNLPGLTQGNSSSTTSGKFNLRLSIRPVASSDDVAVRQKVIGPARKKAPLVLPLAGIHRTKQPQPSVKGTPIPCDVKGYSVVPVTVATPTFSKFSLNDLALTNERSKSPSQGKASDTSTAPNSTQDISYRLELPEFNSLAIETSAP
ncbi:hypothetical protein IWQ61_001541 [Dispira simplex]|nr:hypothetical protein IWQ61_001541 [Dispira simplex]